MIDIASQLQAIHREVGKRPTDGGEVVSVLLRRDYDAPIEDVWEAMTDPDRIKRWFFPVSGDLRAGGLDATQNNDESSQGRDEQP